MIIGVLLILFAILSSFTYFLDHDRLSNYGKGFVWGKGILLLLGGGMVMLALRLGRKTS